MDRTEQQQPQQSESRVEDLPGEQQQGAQPTPEQDEAVKGGVLIGLSQPAITDGTSNTLIGLLLPAVQKPPTLNY